MDAIFNRRSIRKFKDEKVPRDLIMKMIEAGRMAPSAKNRQPWKYIVFEGQQREIMLGVMEQGLIAALNEPSLPKGAKPGVLDAQNTLRIMRGAPTIILIINTNGTTPFGPPQDIFGRITEITDCLSIGASVENMLLTATEEGLGTLWIANTFFAHEPLRAFLGSENQLAGAIAVGFPNEVPEMRPRKTTEDIVEFRG